MEPPKPTEVEKQATTPIQPEKVVLEAPKVEEILEKKEDATPKEIESQPAEVKEKVNEEEEVECEVMKATYTHVARSEQELRFFSTCIYSAA